MERLWPSPAHEEVAARADETSPDGGGGAALGDVGADPRLLAELLDRTDWVGANFVSSLDGAIRVEGVSGPLGSTGDRQVFLRLRDLADAVLVGAGTVRAERYGPTRLRAAGERARRGQSPRPRLVIVTRSCDLLGLDRLWSDPEAPITVLTGAGAPADRVAGLQQRGAEVLQVGDGGPDLVAGLETLRERGLARLLSEGGPTLHTDMLALGLLTDLFTTIAPVVVGGADSMVPLRLPEPLSLRLEAVRRWGDELLLHHRVV